MSPALLALLVAAAAPQSGPAKLMVSTANGVAFTDYPSRERCEAGRAELVKAWHRAQETSAPAGYRIVSEAPLMVLCVSG